MKFLTIDFPSDQKFDDRFIILDTFLLNLNKHKEAFLCSKTFES